MVDLHNLFEQHLETHELLNRIKQIDDRLQAMQRHMTDGLEARQCLNELAVFVFLCIFFVTVKRSETVITGGMIVDPMIVALLLHAIGTFILVWRRRKSWAKINIEFPMPGPSQPLKQSVQELEAECEKLRATIRGNLN